MDQNIKPSISITRTVIEKFAEEMATGLHAADEIALVIEKALNTRIGELGVHKGWKEDLSLSEAGIISALMEIEGACEGSISKEMDEKCVDGDATLAELIEEIESVLPTQESGYTDADDVLEHDTRHFKHPLPNAESQFGKPHRAKISRHGGPGGEFKI